MNQTPETLALQHALAIGRTHRQALGEALEDLRLRDLRAAELESLNKRIDACLINLLIDTLACRTIWEPDS